MIVYAILYAHIITFHYHLVCSVQEICYKMSLYLTKIVFVFLII